MSDYSLANFNQEREKLEAAIRAMPTSAAATERTNEVRVSTHTTTPNTADRKKTWAPRSRTGCFTCRRRRIKCDEATPVCRRCKVGKHECRYPEGLVPFCDSKGDAAGVKAQSSNKSICAQPVPPDWDFIEAIHFYYTVIKPTRPTQGGKIVDPVFKRVDAPFYVSGVVLLQLSFVSKRLGRRLRYGEDPGTLGALWRNHAKYLAEVLAITNRSIREGTPEGTVSAIRSIDHLIGISMALESLLWKAHVDGALAYVESIGGAEVMETWSPQTPMMFIAFFRHVIFYNTTTPALQHSLGYSNYTDKQLELFLDETRLTSDKPFPVGQRLAVVHITRLRHQLATSPLSDQASASIVGEVFQRLTNLDTEAWAQRIQGFEPCVNRALAEIGHDAVWLYAILSLPRRVMLLWAKTQPPLPSPDDDDDDAYNRYRSLYRRRLMARIRELLPEMQHPAALNWPLVVAGVAAADGPAEDRLFVEDSLYAIWQRRIGGPAPFLCLEKLREFWAWGKTGWEECFYEPTPC